MKILTIILIILLSAVPALAQSQIPNPPVPMPGRIGPGGNYPLFNGGTIQITGNYTMVVPDFTASIIRFTGTLAATATITAPSTGTNPFGFEFTIQNATTGGHDIIVKGATGSGVTIPNGKTMMVMFDGTNYVSVGAASAGGGGGTEKYVMADDLRNYGVKADGQYAGEGCGGDVGTNIASCFDFSNNHQIFVPSDVGKLIVLTGLGPPNGTVWPDTPNVPDRYRVASCAGCSGGVDGLQPITFTDETDGCSLKDGQPNYDTMPYYWVNVVNGVPTGNLVLSDSSFRGDKCTHPPHKGRVRSVTGEATFTGGYMMPSDLPSIITRYINSFEVEIADTIQGTTGRGQGAVFGSDDHDAFEAACNAMPAHKFTFHGIMMLSHGVSCNNAHFELEGAGYVPIKTLNADRTQAGSTIVYAGKGTPPPGVQHDWILEIANGMGAKVSRMAFKGNSMATPYAIMISLNRTDAGGVNGNVLTHGKGLAQMNAFDQLWVGFQYGDDFGGLGYGLQSCFFANVAPGNGDFMTIDRTYCYGSEAATDANNTMAVGWHFGKFHSVFNKIGFVCVGHTDVDELYTEFNRVDIEGGSPNWPGGFCATLKMGYGGESSAKMFETSPLNNGGGAYFITSSGGGFGLASSTGTVNPNFLPCAEDPNGCATMIDARSVHKFEFDAPLPTGTKIALSNRCGGNGAAAGYLFTGPPDQISWSYDQSAGCTNLEGTSFKNPSTRTDIVQEFGVPDQPPYGVMRRDDFYLNVTGSILTRTPTPPGEATIPWTGKAFGPQYFYWNPGTARGLRASVDNSQTTIPLNNTGTRAVAGWISSVIRVGDEFMQVECDLSANPASNCNSYSSWSPPVWRGTHGTTAVPHNQGDRVTYVSGDERGGGMYGKKIGYLRSNINATETIIPIAWMKVGDDIRIGDEYMTVTDMTDNMNPHVTRGARGSQVAAHISGSLVQQVVGSTTYHYDVTCSDAQGNETAVGKNEANEAGYTIGPFNPTITDMPATLNDYEWNILFFWPHRGCASYNLYGDEGSGEIGFLTSASRANMKSSSTANFPTVAFGDFGQWTKDTNRKPPSTTQSGLVAAVGGFKAGDITGLEQCIEADPTGHFHGTGQKCGTGTGGGGDGGGSPTGAAGGDLTGNFPNPHVAGLGGSPLPLPLPSFQNPGYLYWNGSWSFSNPWAPGTKVNWDFTGADNRGVQFSDSSPTPPGSSVMMLLASTHDNVTPLYVASHNGRDFQVNGQGDVTVNGGGNVIVDTGRFKGNVQLPAALAGKGSLGTDPSGNIIEGTGSTDGGFTAGGDLGGSSTSQQVIGLHGHPLPASTGQGNLHWDGSAWSFAAAGGGNGLPLGTKVNWDFTADNRGIQFLDSSPTTPLSSVMMILASAHENVVPLYVASPNGKDFQVNGQGDVTVTGGGNVVVDTGKFKGNVQLPAALAGKASLGTDPSGNIIEGSGVSGGDGGGSPTGAAGGDLTGNFPNPHVAGLGGSPLPLPLPSFQNPGYLYWNGSWSFSNPWAPGTQVNWDFTAHNRGIQMSDSSPTTPLGSVMMILASTHDNVTPLYVETANGNVVSVDGAGNLALRAGAKLQLDTLKNHAYLGTDPQGFIVGREGIADVGVWDMTRGMVASVGDVAAHPMAAPTTDTTYYLTWQLEQVDAGSGGTCDAGTFGLILQFTPLHGNEIHPHLSGHAFNASTASNSFAAGTTIDENTYFVGVPFEFSAKGGTTVTLVLTQTVASNCSTGQNFALKAHLKTW